MLFILRHTSIGGKTMDNFDTQIQIEETNDKIFEFMAEILSTCSDEELAEIFEPIKNS